MSKYINPFTDVGFKRIFGQEINKDMLISFLNNVIEEFDITDVTFLDKEQLPDIDEQRSLIYDIYCKTSDGQYIIVEMQNRSQPFFKDRSLYYISKSVTKQAQRAHEWMYKLSAVYLIAFLNFEIPDISREFRTDVGLTNLKTHEPFSDKLRLIYLQLPLFNDDEDSCDTLFKCWIYTLKNMEILDRMPFTARDAVFRQLEKIAEVRSLTEQEQVQYDASLRNYRDTIAVMTGQYLDGLKEGREEGIKAGHEEGIKAGREEGIKAGREEGIKAGREEGIKAGREEGIKAGREEGIKAGREEGIKAGR
ncbi:MAG: Rpn family recombination-promoting nuclease/putative transposase, partial [Muribaculaceae bacterium]|nr:Rpn family recombination-promoting nuclease/putative transposase [Muribaculaceae bacterium]